MFDCLIVNGTVIDGTGRPGERADVALAGDRIVRIGRLDGQPARLVVDAVGRVVAPGFIDVHNHDEAWLLKDAIYSVKTIQGYTSPKTSV
jgi:N-acyl-D-amino-acid deacylase